MGAYLSEPVTTKISCDKSNENMSFGASGMQGWRVSMEDAHTAILDYDEDTSFFAVYDGHGGSEVATYTADNLPKFLKNVDEYKSGDLKGSMINGFLQFDQHLLEDEVMTALRNLAGVNNSEPEVNELDSLAEEAEIPLEELLLKLKEKGYCMPEADVEEETTPIKDSTKGESSKEKKVSEVHDETEEVKEKNEKTEEVKEKNEKTEEVKEKNEKTDEVKEKNKKTEEVKEKNEKTEEVKEKNEKIDKVKKKNEKTEEVKEKNGETEQSKLDEKESKGEDVKKKKPEESKEKAKEVEEEEQEEEDSEDDDMEDDDDDDDDEDDENNHWGDGDEVGYDSGTTAVVALLKKDRLVVGNVGDSRCVLCRNGVAIDMSLDHKPENDKELTRIKNAGGRVTGEGRVNGGLNLSRALGDHRYKGTSHLGADEQQITAMPDVKETEITEADKFLVLACDGIWNVLSSQEVVDFVWDRLAKQIENDDVSLSKICEELFDRCLSSDTSGDGTGCDNMTAIIVLLNRDFTKNTKRKLNEENKDDESSAKKPKTE